MQVPSSRRKYTRQQRVKGKRCGVTSVKARANAQEMRLGRRPDLGLDQKVLQISHHSSKEQKRKQNKGSGNKSEVRQANYSVKTLNNQ